MNSYELIFSEVTLINTESCVFREEISSIHFFVNSEKSEEKMVLDVMVTYKIQSSKTVEIGNKKFLNVMNVNGHLCYKSPNKY